MVRRTPLQFFDVNDVIQYVSVSQKTGNPSSLHFSHFVFYVKILWIVPTIMSICSLKFLTVKRWSSSTKRSTESVASVVFSAGDLSFCLLRLRSDRRKTIYRTYKQVKNTLKANLLHVCVSLLFLLAFDSLLLTTSQMCAFLVHWMTPFLTSSNNSPRE